MILYTTATLLEVNIMLKIPFCLRKSPTPNDFQQNRKSHIITFIRYETHIITVLPLVFEQLPNDNLIFSVTGELHTYKNS